MLDLTNLLFTLTPTQHDTGDIVSRITADDSDWYQFRSTLFSAMIANSGKETEFALHYINTWINWSIRISQMMLNSKMKCSQSPWNCSSSRPKWGLKIFYQRISPLPLGDHPDCSILGVLNDQTRRWVVSVVFVGFGKYGDENRFRDYL